MKGRFAIKVMLGLLLIPGFQERADAQTVVFDQEIYWDYPVSSYGGYGFYWWHRNWGSYNTINYGDMSPTDWTTPENYYNGTFQLRFEVLEMPTDENFYIAFGLWQDYSKSPDYPETVGEKQLISPGSVFYGDIGSPTNWWNKEPGDKVDFTRPEDFFHIGIVLFNVNPFCIPMGKDWNSDGCPENAYKFFPMRAKVTITATSSDTPPPPPPGDAPNYSVDYSNERTNKVISTADQYSYQSNFSTVFNGANNYLTLNPGQTVYFRLKADYSKKQTLNVAQRPSPPSFGIDYDNERTSATVSADMEYADHLDMSGASSGNGDYVSLFPGMNKYFRQKASASSFRSEVQTLTVPVRPVPPDVGIDFVNETTNIPIGSNIEYADNSDLIGAMSGTGSYLPLLPGSDLFLRMKANASAFRSEVQHLEAPARPATPSFLIDYVNEKTAQPVLVSDEYALNADMSGAVSGSGLQLGLEPGTNLYFRTKAGVTAYASEIQTLTVPTRPAAPVVSIDYANETSVEPINTNMGYSANPDMNPSIPGSGQVLILTPGTDQYFRYLPSVVSFASEISALDIVSRPSITSTEVGTTQMYPFLATINFFHGASNLTIEGISSVNATLGSVGLLASSPVLSSYQALVYGIADGPLSLEVKANAVTEGNFKSLPFSIYFKKDITGIANLDEDKIFGLYPNPSTGKFNISSTLPAGTLLQLSLYNSSGRMVYNDEFPLQNESLLDLEKLDQGVYFLMISTEENNLTRKIVIQK